MFPVLLHPYGIALTFFTLYSWLPGAGLIPKQPKMYSIRKKLSFMQSKCVRDFLENVCNHLWVQFHAYRKLHITYYIKVKRCTKINIQTNYEL